MSSKNYIFENDISEEQDLTFNSLTRAFNENGMDITDRNIISLGIKKSNNLYTNLGFILSDQSSISVKVAEYDKIEEEPEVIIEEQNDYTVPTIIISGLGIALVIV